MVNSDGGQLNIEFEDDTILEVATDGILRTTEQNLIDITDPVYFTLEEKCGKGTPTKQLVLMVVSTLRGGLQHLSSN